MIEQITEACNGCEVCVLACAKDVIAMRPSTANRRGKVAYIVDARKCFVCYNCERLCPVEAIVVNDEKPPEAFVKHVPAFGEAPVAPGQGQRVRSQLQDVLMVGAGAAGLAAAIAAREAGASVTVLEKAPDVADTNTSRAGGGITIAMERELRPEAHRFSPEEKAAEALALTDDMVNPELIRVWALGIDDTISWLKGHGLRLSRTHFRFHKGSPLARDFAVRPIGCGAGLQKQLLTMAQQAGCHILFNTRAERLLTDSQGRVRGARARTPGSLVDFRAGAVVLATAGFQANQEMLLRYFGPDFAYGTRLTGSPFATGDGHLMATELGAQQVNMNVCHGRNIDSSWVPGSTGRDGPVRDLRLTCHRGILVNRLGKRFVDESLTSDILANSIRAQPGQEAAIIYDERMRAMRPTETEGYRPKGMIRTFASMRELALGVGLPYEELDKTVRGYNAAIVDGTTSHLDVPKTGEALHLDAPPFYVVYPVWFGLNCTLGGPKINPQAQVLDRDDLPIPGLFAAGEMIGGFYFGRHHTTPGGAVYWRGNYQVTSGALSMCLLYGRIAGVNAARLALSRSG